MSRTSLLFVVLLFTGCGVERAAGAVEDPLVAAVPSAPAPTARLEPHELIAQSRALAQLRPMEETVQVHSLAVPDGTQVRYLLGMVGCGISVLARGTATVQGGAFVIPYDPEAAYSPSASLYFQLGEVCDPETSQVFEVGAQLPGAIDLSTLPEQSFAGCWLFDAAD